MAIRRRFNPSEIRSIFGLDTEGFEEDSEFFADTEDEVWIVRDPEKDEDICRFDMHLAERLILATL